MACLKSLMAPLVTLSTPNLISSARRPPIAVAMLAFNYREVEELVGVGRGLLLPVVWSGRHDPPLAKIDLCLLSYHVGVLTPMIIILIFICWAEGGD